MGSTSSFIHRENPLRDGRRNETWGASLDPRQSALFITSRFFAKIGICSTKTGKFPAVSSLPHIFSREFGYTYAHSLKGGKRPNFPLNFFPLRVPANTFKVEFGNDPFHRMDFFALHAWLSVPVECDSKTENERASRTIRSTK